MTTYTRVRTTSDSSPKRSTYLWSYDGSTNNTPEWESFTYFKQISDIGPGTYSGARVKPVLNYDVRYRGAYLQPFNGDWGSTITPSAFLPYLPIGNVVSAAPLPSDNLMGSLHREAFNDFSTRFPEQLSFAEFAVGLRDLKQLLPSLQNSILKTLASLYLQKKFAWDNLLSDLNVLQSLIKGVEKRMKFLKDTYGKPTPLYFFRQRVTEEETPQTATVYELELERAWGIRLVRTSHRCDYRASCMLLQQLEHIDDAIGYLRAIVGALGLNNPLKAVWVNLPMSFVVDWFFDVSTRLDTLARIEPAEPWSVYDICHSIKFSARFDVYQFTYPESLWGGSSPSPDRKLGEVELKGYRRDLGLPFDVTSIGVDKLSPDQLVLLLAMTVGYSH